MSLWIGPGEVRRPSTMNISDHVTFQVVVVEEGVGSDFTGVISFLKFFPLYLTLTRWNSNLSIGSER